MKDREVWLELGLVGLVLSLLAGAGVALAASASAQRHRRRRHGLPPPELGSIHPGSHQNISATPAR